MLDLKKNVILCMIWGIIPHVFALITHFKFYKFLFQIMCSLKNECNLPIMPMWVFLLHLFGNNHFTEEKEGQKPLL